MVLDVSNLGSLIRDARLQARLSQPEAARRAGVSVRLWSETERGARPHVSAATLFRIMAEVGVVLEARSAVADQGGEATNPSSAPSLATLRDDLREAAAFGVDLSMIRATLRKTPLQRVRENDEALEFFGSFTVERGWTPRPTSARSAAIQAEQNAKGAR